MSGVTGVFAFVCWVFILSLCFCLCFHFLQGMFGLGFGCFFPRFLTAFAMCLHYFHWPTIPEIFKRAKSNFDTFPSSVSMNCCLYL